MADDALTRKEAEMGLTKEQIEKINALYVEASTPDKDGNLFFNNIFEPANVEVRLKYEVLCAWPKLRDLALRALSLESVREEALEEKFWVVEAVNEDDTVLSPPAYWYGGFIGSTVAGHVGSDIHAFCTRFQNAQTAEYVKCLLRNAKINPDRGHHWKIFKHVIVLQHAPARVAEGEKEE